MLIRRIGYNLLKMNQDFESNFFAGNRQRLLDGSGAKLIVLTANGLLQRSADTTFAFRQDSNFWYLTGIEEPDFLLVMTPEETFLIAPSRPDQRDMWDGAVDKRQLQAISGINLVLDHHAGWTKLDMLLKKLKKVHTITPAEAYFERFGFYANPARATLLTALKKHRSLELVDIRKVIASMRQIKQGPELQAIKEAIEITAKSIEKVLRKVRTYKYEHQITADITAEFLRLGATGHAYLPIVATGDNATTLHYVNNQSRINKTDLILIDVGAEVNNYSADISRTFAVTKPSARQYAVHKAVLSVQTSALKLLKPGVVMKEYEQAVDKLMAKELLSLGLLEDVDDQTKLKKYFPHLASHFLGLDTHDSADYDLPLLPGMVLTVEPGIYIPEENLGVRIEDNVLITEKGNEVLSASLSSSLFRHTI